MTPDETRAARAAVLTLPDDLLEAPPKPRRKYTPRATIPVWDRIAARLIIGDCWEWTGARVRGYGVIGRGRSNQGLGLVHRIAWETLVGPIPDGLHIDHFCRNRRCCNPDHLEPVTQAENNRRIQQYNRWQATCKRGHPRSPGEWRQDTNQRRCLTCSRERYARKRQAAGDLAA